MKSVASIVFIAQLLAGLQLTAAPTSKACRKSCCKKVNKKLLAFGLAATGVAVGLIMKRHDQEKIPIKVEEPPIPNGVSLFFRGWGYPLDNKRGLCTRTNTKYCNGMDDVQFIQALRAADTTGEWTKLLGSRLDSVISYPYNNSGGEIVVKSNITYDQAFNIQTILTPTAPLGAKFTFRIG